MYGDIQYIANSFCKNVLKIVTPSPRFWIQFLNVFFLLLSIYYFITCCAEIYIGEIICIIWYIRTYIILHSVFWVSCWMHAHQILLMLIAPRERSRVGLVYSTVGWLPGWNGHITCNTNFWVFSISSLFVAQAAENIAGRNAMRATGRLWILTRYCLMGNGESCVTRSWMICTPYPILCGWWNRDEWDGKGMWRVWERIEGCTGYWWGSLRERGHWGDHT